MVSDYIEQEFNLTKTVKSDILFEKNRFGGRRYYGT